MGDSRGRGFRRIGEGCTANGSEEDEACDGKEAKGWVASEGRVAEALARSSVEGAR